MRDRLGAKIGLGATAAPLRRIGAGEGVEIAFQTLGVDGAQSWSLARDVIAEGHHRAAKAFRIAALVRKVPAPVRAERLSIQTLVRGDRFDRLDRLRQSMRASRSLQIVLRFEMIVEAAVGHAGRMHEIGDADAFEAFFTEKPRSEER